MKKKPIISILTITSLLFLASCDKISKKDAIVIGATILAGAAFYYYMNQQDKEKMQEVLEYSPKGEVVSWESSDRKTQLNMAANNDLSKKDDYCRTYTLVEIVDEESKTHTGRACRNSDGHWDI